MPSPHEIKIGDVYREGSYSAYTDWKVVKLHGKGIVDMQVVASKRMSWENQIGHIYHNWPLGKYVWPKVRSSTGYTSIKCKCGATFVLTEADEYVNECPDCRPLIAIA